MAHEIETCEESNALQAAYNAWVEANPSDEDDERLAFRAGWLAGRDYGRELAHQEAVDAEAAESDYRERYERAVRLLDEWEREQDAGMQRRQFGPND